MQFSHRQYVHVGEKIQTASALLKGEEPRCCCDTQSLFFFHFVTKSKFLIAPETKFRVTELPQATLTYSVNRTERVQRKLSLSVSGLLVWVFDLSG